MNYSIVVEVYGSKSVQGLYKLFSYSESKHSSNTGLRSLHGSEPISKLLEDGQGEDQDSEIKVTVVEMRVKDDKIVAEWKGHGTIRLFKSGSTTAGVEGSNDSEDDLVRVPGDNSMCSILFTPSYLTCDELLHWFLGPTILNQVSHFRLVKLHGKKGECMVLMKFRNYLDAKRFQSEYNGKRFNSIDPETCHVVFVKEIVFKEKLLPDPNKDFPYLLRDPFTNGSGMVELPTCPVCLERMDSEVTGLITTACQHTFHCNCLNQWKGGKCPVCRYSNKEHLEGSRQASCNACGSKENLWVCLVCGHMGCGRYNSKHAIHHYEETSHCFAMDITTNRVWDYAGDNYVHRLAQNEVDGKLVEVGGSQTKRNQEYHLEYVQVLISQLESQREYYEAKLEEQSNKNTSKEITELTESFQKFKLHTEQSHKKLESKINSLQNQLKEEKLMNLGLTENLEHITNDRDHLIRDKENLSSQITEMQQTVDDLMFHLQTTEKLRQDPDAEKGTIVIHNTDTPSSSSKKAARKKKPPHRFGK
ncbi:HGL073Cp [Eremothecium sinecaudum]|uniref:HGL073Cp n=1 Tax=Eremothecium sinecaudum TaxID=45286 RepID=A0A0X8HVG1_9SACH|nr:HGL073Cp [Eremothecium sinecaudum]AMD22267.1 HGL073Cp [Eremothecium sinecaudum]